MSDDFENTAEGLIPMIEPAQWLDEMLNFELPLPIHQPFVAGLYLTYVLDFDTYTVSMAPAVVQQFVGEFNPPIERVHEVALQNLRCQHSPDDFQIQGEGAHRRIVCQPKDKLAAARILLFELLAEWNELLPGKLLIGIPYRDYLVAFSDQDPDFVAQMQQEIQNESDELGYPIYQGLLVWDGELLREY
jgi:hypothetical protein